MKEGGVFIFAKLREKYQVQFHTKITKVAETAIRCTKLVKTEKLNIR